MRVLNSRQLRNLPVVDRGNLYLDEMGAAEQLSRERVLREQQKSAQMALLRKKAIRAEQLRQEAVRAAEAAKHRAMLERSLRRSGHREAYAAQKQGSGYVKQFGMNAPLMGFAEADEVRPQDFLQQEVFEAPQFNNHLTAKDCKGYTQYKDWPLVMDAPNAMKSDFQGVLVNEANSPDFSQRIVDDTRRDFGYVPQRRRRR